MRIIVFTEKIILCAIQGGFTSLHLASSRGHKEVTELLLERGASRDKADKVLHVYSHVVIETLVDLQRITLIGSSVWDSRFIGWQL